MCVSCAFLNHATQTPCSVLHVVRLCVLQALACLEPSLMGFLRLVHQEFLPGFDHVHMEDLVVGLYLVG